MQFALRKINKETQKQTEIFLGLRFPCCNKVYFNYFHQYFQQEEKAKDGIKVEKEEKMDTGPSAGGADEDDDVDPLDAFMQGNRLLQLVSIHPLWKINLPQVFHWGV